MVASKLTPVPVSKDGSVNVIERNVADRESMSSQRNCCVIRKYSLLVAYPHTELPCGAVSEM